MRGIGETARIQPSKSPVQESREDAGLGWEFAAADFILVKFPIGLLPINQMHIGACSWESHCLEELFLTANIR